MDEALAELGIELPRSRKLACPQHSADRGTPPLHVYEDHFYCFGCGKHGDGIGLIAWFTGQDVRQLVATRSEQRKSSYNRLATKGMSPRDATKAAYVKYHEIHKQFFRDLAEIHADSPSWYYEMAISRWSEVFDDYTDWVKGHNLYDGDEPPAPHAQEQRLNLLAADLRTGLEFERKDAKRLREG